jgi:hypothetical protein
LSSKSKGAVSCSPNGQNWACLPSAGTEGQ